MKLVLLPFIVIAAFDITLFALARLGRRIAGRHELDEVVSSGWRSALRPDASMAGRGVRVSRVRKRSGTAVQAHHTVSPPAAPFTLTLVETSS